MKKLIVLLAVLCILSACSAPEDLSQLLDAPDASLGDRPGYKPEEVSGVLEEDPSYAAEPSKRSMGLTETEAVGLYRVVTRTGDLAVLGMTYGDGHFFALSQRERGYFLTGYGEDTKGTFSGMLNQEYTSPALLGFAGGFACLYCPESDLTLACRGDGSYIQLRREDADAVWLFDGGYAMQRGQTVALYPPDKKDPVASYTLPEGYTWVSGNATGAWVQKDGTVALLSADGKLSGGLSPLLSVWGEGYLCKRDGFSVVINPLQGIAYVSRNVSALPACGADYTVELTSAGLRFTLPAQGKTALLPVGMDFVFGGRTEKGFLYATDGVWYWFAATSVSEEAPAAYPFSSGEDPLQVAASCAKNALASLLGTAVSSDGASSDGLAATGVTDSGLLFTACEVLAGLAESHPLPTEKLFLCSALLVEGTAAPYAVTEEGIFLNVSDTEALEEQFLSLWEEVNHQEEPEE